MADGASFSEVDHLLWTELAIGAVFVAAAFALFRAFEFEGRRRASLETF